MSSALAPATSRNGPMRCPASWRRCHECAFRRRSRRRRTDGGACQGARRHVAARSGHNYSLAGPERKMAAMNKALLDELMRLSPAERIELAEQLWDSIPVDSGGFQL